MHILLGLLGAVVTILVLLDRLGVDLGGLNPFAWRRRRSWRNRFEANPAFSLTDAREIAAMLIVGVAKVDGDLSASEKHSVLAEFESTLAMSPRTATELLSATVYMQGDMRIVHEQLDELLARYAGRLEPAQVDSLLEILARIAALDGGATEAQSAMIGRIEAALRPPPATGGTWN